MKFSTTFIGQVYKTCCTCPIFMTIRLLRARVHQKENSHTLTDHFSICSHICKSILASTDYLICFTTMWTGSILITATVVDIALVYIKTDIESARKSRKINLPLQTNVSPLPTLVNPGLQLQMTALFLGQWEQTAFWLQPPLSTLQVSKVNKERWSYIMAK